MSGARASRPERVELCEPDDATLVASARGGSIDAWGVLVARHRLTVERVARSYARPSDVDDVVSDVMASLWSALSRGRGPTGSVVNYLAVSARHAAGERQRRARREQPVEDERLFASLPPVELALSHEDLAEALAQLTPRHRQVLWWSVVEGRKPQDFAGELGLTDNAAAAVALRARRSLARTMKHATD